MTKKIRSAIPIYLAALVWLVYGLLLPLYTLRHILSAAAISVAVYILGCYIFPGRTVQVEEKIKTGDDALDKQLNDARALLHRLHAANDAIPDAAISQKLDRMEAVGLKILSRVAEKPSEADHVRRFMNYYLPTADKLMASYRLMMETDSPGENIDHAMKSVENSLEMIATAFERQLDNLYKDKSLDIETDIQVLETMMAGDGLTGGSFTQQAGGQGAVRPGN